MSEIMKSYYTVIGAGPAGISAAEAIRKFDPDKNIQIINGERWHPYCRPLIVEVLRGERKFNEIYLREESWFADNNIDLLHGDRVVKIRSNEKQVELESGKVIEWEKLLIAAGSVPAFPPIRGLDDVPVHTLYRQDDVDKLKPQCQSGKKVLLAGMGLIGLQAMTSLKKLGLDVVAVELLPKVLPLILNVKAAQIAQKRLEEHGIDVHVGKGVSELKVLNRGEHAYQAVLDNGEEIGFDILVVATGMKPDFTLLDGSGIEFDQGIKVNASMKTSVADIYAAGDVTEYNNWIENRSEIHAHWVNAVKQGEVAGANMAGSVAKEYEPLYLNSLSIFGLPIITMGASRIDNPEGSQVYCVEAPERDMYSRLVIKDGKVIAATFINDFDRAGIYQYMMREKVDVGEIAESLFKSELKGMEFLYGHHDELIRGKVEWPESMYAIQIYKKDHSHTRWGKDKEGGKKE